MRFEQSRTAIFSRYASPICLGKSYSKQVCQILKNMVKIACAKVLAIKSQNNFVKMFGSENMQSKEYDKYDNLNLLPFCDPIVTNLIMIAIILYI